MFAINVNTVEILEILKLAQASDEIKRMYFDKEEEGLLATKELLIQAINFQMKNKKNCCIDDLQTGKEHTSETKLGI